MTTHVQATQVQKSTKTVSKQGEKAVVKGVMNPASSYALPHVKIADIIRDGNVRPIDPDKVKQYALSIKKSGLIDRPTLEKEGDKYRILSGFHRIAALESLGWDTIPVQFMNEKRGSQVILTANIAHHNMPPMQIARNFKAYCEVDDVVDETKVKDLAAQLGRTVAYVKEYIKLTNMIGEFQTLAEKLDSGFTKEHALALSAGEKGNQRATFQLWQKSPGVSAETLKRWMKNPAKAAAEMGGAKFVEPKRPGMDGKDEKAPTYSVSQAYFNEVKRLTQGKAAEGASKYELETVNEAAQGMMPLMELICQRLADGKDFDKMIQSLLEVVKE